MKEKVVVVKYDNVVPVSIRGKITGKLPVLPVRTGGDLTNKQYASDKGITKRQASKERRGY